MSLPGGPVSARPLHFIWIVDCSGSMQGEKINSLNTAIREVIPHMRKVADDNPHAEVLVRALKFSSGASWHISTTPIQQFTWTDLAADGVTDIGRALRMVADQLKSSQMPERGFPPVLALVSDGQPTDDFEGGLKELMQQPWGKKAVRVAIAIGGDANHDVLQKFIGHPEIKILEARNPESLAARIRFVSTAVLGAASSPASRTKVADGSSNVNIPVPPPDTGPSNAGDIW